VKDEDNFDNRDDFYEVVLSEISVYPCVLLHRDFPEAAGIIFIIS
jgi:hypothetical protein